MATYNIKKILDIGCGSGRFTLAFAKLGAKLSVGVDLGDDDGAFGAAAQRHSGLV